MVLTMKRVFLSFISSIFVLSSVQLALASDYPPRTPSPVNVRQIHSGHSLTDAYMSGPWPGQLILATDTIRGAGPLNSIRGTNFQTIGHSSIPGSNLRWRWNNEAKYGAPDARNDIQHYELLVTTEAVPLSPDADYFKENTLDFIEKWVDNSWKNGNRGQGAELMLYSTWVWWENPDDLRPGGEGHIPFRERLEIEEQRWEQIQDHANAVRPSGMPRIYMIPGHRLMMRIYDDIEAGKVPGVDSIGDLFLDTIHLNQAGAYAVTCLIFAVIYQRDPASLPNRYDIGNGDVVEVPFELAEYFKATAMDVARNYERSGVPK